MVGAVDFAVKFEVRVIRVVEVFSVVDVLLVDVLVDDVEDDVVFGEVVEVRGVVVSRLFLVLDFVVCLDVALVTETLVTTSFVFGTVVDVFFFVLAVDVDTFRVDDECFEIFVVATKIRLSPCCWFSFTAGNTRIKNLSARTVCLWSSGLITVRPADKATFCVLIGLNCCNTKIDANRLQMQNNIIKDV